MLRNLFRSNAIYALGTAANSAALLLLIPYLVNALSPAAYGAWSLYEIGIVFLTMLILAGFDVGMMREYWAQDEELARRRLTGSVMALVGGWGVCLLGLLWIAASLSRGSVCAIGGAACDLLRPDWLALVFAIALLESFFSLLLTILRIREQAGRFATLSFLRLGLFLAAATAGVQITGDVGGALIGRLLAALVSLGIATAMVHKHIIPAFDGTATKRVLRYGLPLLPANLAAYILLASDRYILQSVSTLEVVAVYAFAYKIATGLDVLVNRPFALDWAARRFKMANQPDAAQSYATVLPLYLYVAGSVALLMAAVVPLAYSLIAPAAYLSGLGLVPVLLAAQVIYGASSSVNVGIMLKDGTHYLPIISWVAAIACLALNAWWIEAYGASGAAWATLVAYLVYTLGIAGVSLWLYPVPYSLGHLGLIAAMLALGVCGIMGIDSLSLSLLIATGLKLFCSLCVSGLAGYKLWGAWLRTHRLVLPVGDSPPLGSG